MASSENNQQILSLGNLPLKNPVLLTHTHQNGPLLIQDQDGPNTKILQAKSQKPLKFEHFLNLEPSNLQVLNQQQQQENVDILDQYFSENKQGNGLLEGNQQKSDQKLKEKEEEKIKNRKFISSQIRFEAQNCTEKIVLSPSGLMVQPSVGEKQQLAVTNVCLEEGQHYFEILCTFSCENIQIGLVKKGYSLEDIEKNQYIGQKFKTSTPRTVGILVDFDNNKLQWWLNGNYQKQREQVIPQGQWYLSVQIKDTGNCIILNPNAQRPDCAQKNYIYTHNISQNKKLVLGQKLTENQEQEVSQVLKKLEEKLLQEQQQNEKEIQQQTQQSNISTHYLNKSQNLLVKKENKLKLIRKSKNGQYSLNSTLFVNKPNSMKSQILLLLQKNNLINLIQVLDLNKLLAKNINLAKFLNFSNALLNANLNQQQYLEITIQFQDACDFIIATSELIGKQIQEMELILLYQENIINQQQKQLQIQENQEEKIEHDVYKHNQNLQFQYKSNKITLEDLYRALQTVNNLNEQLFAMSQNKPQLLKAFNNNYNRLFSTFYRLGTFLGNTNQKLDLIELSEYGLFNEYDCLNQLKHFEQQKIQLEDIQNDKNEIQITGLNLLKQIPESRHLQSISSANVEIDTFINSLPYQEHESQKPVSLLVNPNSNIITSYNSEGNLNFWNTQLTLQNVGQTDFKKPFIQLSKNQIQGETVDKAEQQILGFEEPYLFKLIENSISDSIWVIEKPIQQIEKEQKTQPENQANPEIVDALVMMGFPPHVSQLAAIKTNNKGVQDAMDIIFDIQTEEEKKTNSSTEEQIKPIWNCSACTLENEAPNKKCNVCETPAPKDAYYTQTELRKIQEQKAAAQREQEQKLKQKQLEEQKLKEEQEKAQKKKEEEEKLKKIQQQIQFSEQASFLKPIQIDLQFSKMCPLIAGGVLNSESQNLSQVKLRRLGYNPRFLKQFYKPCKNGYICTLNNEWIIDSSIQSVEQTLFGNKNNQLVVEALNRQFFQDQTQQFLEISEQIINIEGEQVIDVTWSQSSTHQENDKENVFIYILTNKNLIIYELLAKVSDPYSIENNIQVKELQKVPLQSELQNQQNTQLFASQSFETQEILLLNQQTFSYFNIKNKTFTQNQKYHNNSQLISTNILNNNTISLLLSDKTVQNLSINYINLQQKQINNGQQNEEQAQNASQNWAQNLTPQDINSLQKLTYHKYIGGISTNSQNQADLDSQSNLYSKHIWNLKQQIQNQQNQNQNQKFQTFEIDFQKPVSLLNLDIQCNFSTLSDTQRAKNIRQNLLQNFHINSTNLENKGFQIENYSQEQQLQQEQQQEKQQQLQKNTNIQNFSFQQQQNENEGQIIDNDQLYIPLNLVQFQGGVFKSHIYPSQMLTPNKEKFVSNYPETGYVFEHLGGRKINAEKVTIHSSLKQRSAGYPIGFGLIFTADSLADFDHAQYFNSFQSKSDYQNWRKQRLQFSKEIDSWEPVGYFNFDDPESEKITVTLDYRRSSQYIFIKPLNLRSVPKDFTKHYGIESQEITFIGVQGQVLTDGASQKNSSQTQNEHQQQQILEGIYTINQQLIENLDIEISKDGQNWEKLQDLKENLTFQNLILPNISKYQLNRPQNLQKIVDFYLQNGVSIDFLSQVTIQPRQLTNSLIKAVRIQFNSQNLQQQNYLANQISVQSIGSVDPQIKNVKTYEIRSALLDQQNYEILNKKLVESLVDPRKSLEYRKNVQKLLSQLMKKEEKLVEKILADLKIKEYIELNILSEKNENFSEVHQFLKNFVAHPQISPQFQKKILNNILEILPQVLTNPKTQATPVGVNGIFALLNWSYIWDQNLAYQELVAQIGQICRLVQQNKNQNYQVLRQNYEISDLSFEKDMFLGNSYSSTVQNWQKHKNQAQIASSQQITSIDSRIASQRSLTSRRIVVDLMNKHAVKDIYLCFGKNLTSLAKFQLNIWAVEDEQQSQNSFEQLKKSLIHSKNYPIHLFLQLANISQEMAYINIFPSNERLESLGLTNFQVSTRYLIFQINWTLNASCVHNSESKSVPSMDIIPEIYGDYLGSTPQNSYLNNLFTAYKESQVTHLKELKIGESKKYQKFQVDSTNNLGTTSLTLYDSLGLYKIGDKICVPGGSSSSKNQNNFQQIDEGLEQHLIDNIKQLDAKLEEQQNLLTQKLQLPVSQKNKSEVTKICQKIDEIQLQKLKLTNKSQQNNFSKKSLYFLYDMASKIATFLKKVKPAQQTQNQKLTQISFQLFETFLIHEEGKIQKQLMQLLEQTLIPDMSETDWQQFVFKVIKIYLQDSPSNAQEEEDEENSLQFYSHSKVVKLLNQLSIPLGEVLAYLAQKLKIKLENIPDSPMIALQQEDSLTLQACLIELLKSGFSDIPLDKYDPTKIEHPGAYCFNCCFNRPIQGPRLKCANCPNLDSCGKKECYQKHLKSNPNHIFIIIQEPLPLTPDKKVTTIQPLLQKPFLFEQKIASAEPENLCHYNISCDQCGSKQIKGIRYMCANCEEHNVCQNCYDKKEHNKVHVFLQFDRVQKITEADKNPVILIPQLDPLLYPLKSQTITAESQKRISKGLSREISREPSLDDVELKPQGMKRSISQPDEQLIKKKYQTKTLKIIEEETVTEFQTVRLDYEDSLIVAFQIAVQTSENQEINQQDKISLLVSNFELLIQIMKLCSMEGIMNLIKRSDKDFFKLLFNVLKQKDQILEHKFVEFLNNIIQPKNAPVKMNEQQLNQLSAHQKQRFLREKNALNQLRLYFIYYLQNLLQWILDYAFNSEQSSNLYTQILREKIPKQQWLEHVEFVLNFLLQSSEKIRQNFRQMTLEKQVSNSKAIAQQEELAQSNNQNEKQVQNQQEGDFDEDDDEVFIQPPQLAKAFSVKDRNQINLEHNSPQKSKDEKNLINQNTLQEYIQKSQGTTFSFKTAVNLISLLLENQQEKQNNLLMKKGYNFSQSPEIWKLIFKALVKVKPSQIIEQKLFKNVIQCFLIATSEVQNLVLRDLLTMTQNIIEQQQGQQKQICYQILTVLFECLDDIYESAKGKDEEKSIKYYLLIGLLDVLITKQSPKPSKFYTENQNNAQTFAKFDQQGANFLLDRASEFLIAYANPGGKDGILMANQSQLTKLLIADDLIRLVVSSNVCDVLLQNIEQENQVQQQLQKLLSWYLMNRTQEKNNTSPGVEYMKSITQSLLVLFTKISEYETCTKICLTELITSLKSTDQILLDFYKKQKISSYTTLSFAERICKSLEELFDIWVNNDELAQHVAFNVQGFEYLLERMGINSQLESSEQNSPQKSPIKQEKLKQQQQFQQITKRADIFSKLKTQYEDLQSKIQGSKAKKQNSSQNDQIQSQQEKQKEDGELTNKIEIAQIGQHNILKDEEIASSVQVINLPGQNLTGAPTDWAQNKKGVRSSKVVECKMQGDFYNEYPVLIKLKEPVEIKSICLGFNCIDTISNTKVLGIPNNVLLEGGLSVDEMFSLGKLEQLEDEGFVNFSVKTFTKNFETIQPNTDGKTQSNLEKSLDTIQNQRVQFLRFRLRRPQISCVDNLSALYGKNFKNVVLQISFLSISGYYISKLPENVKSKIISTQQGSALQTLGKLCNQRYQGMLSQVANDENILEKFKSSFQILSDLLVTYENWLSPLILGIASHNQQMGDWIISNFLRLDRQQQHAKLVCEIILGNQTFSLNRINTVLQFILEQFKAISSNAEQGDIRQLNKYFQSALPFLQNLSNAILISGQDMVSNNKKSPQLTINLTQEDCKHFIELFVIFKESSYRPQIIKLLCVLLFAPEPYQVQNQKQLLNYTLDQLHQILTQETENKLQIFELIQALTIGGECGINWLLKNNAEKLNLYIDQLLAQFEKKKPYSSTKYILNLIVQVSQQQEVKKVIIEQNLHMKIFDKIKNYDPNVLNMVHEHIDKDTIKLIVQFLNNVILGDAENEKKFAQVLTKDIEQLSKKQDMKYVQSILMPLLNAEHTIPVCLHGFDSINNRWLSDPSSILQYSKKLKQEQLTGISQTVNNSSLNKKQENQNQNDEPSYIKSMNSQVLNQTQKNKFIENLKLFANKTNLKNKLENSSWKLAHTCHQDQQSGVEATIKNNVLFKSPFLIILHGTVSGVATSVGIFCNSQMSTYGDYGEYKIPYSKDNFMFYYTEKYQIHFESDPNANLGSFYEEAETSIIVINQGGQERILISYSFDEASDVRLKIADMKIADKDRSSFPFELPSDAFVFGKCEYWVLEEDKSLQKLKEQQQEASTEKIQINQINSLLPQQFYHPSGLQHYRQQSIYNIPSQLEIKKILSMLQAKGKYLKEDQIEEICLKNRKTQQILAQTSQIQEIEQNQQGIIDLEFDALKLFERATLSKQQKLKISENPANYIPKMTIFDAFQEGGGVEKIIETILEQTSKWKNQKRAQNWKVYVMELKSFSALPHFFGLFMKNKECVQLLFSLMAGLPDVEEKDQKDKKSEIDWDKEEQKAVKYSYEILGDVFKDENDSEIRQFAYDNNFIMSILERMAIVSKEKVREFVEEEEEKEEQIVLKKKISNDDGKKEIRKKKGLGYGSDQTGDNKKWDVNLFIESKKNKSEQLKSLLDIILKFLSFNSWDAPKTLLDTLIQSPLLPMIETALNNSLVDMSKENDLMFTYFKLLRIMSKHKVLMPLFFQLDPRYKPKQLDSIMSLMDRARDLAKIYKQVSQTKDSQTEKNDQDKLAQEILDTHDVVAKAYQIYNDEMFDYDEQDQEEEMKKILNMDLLPKYRTLLQDLRFDYVSMKGQNNQYNHHYKSYITQSQPQSKKLVRLAQELADISTGLPIDHTNSIFARCDTDRVDVMKVCIMGSNGTPYGHGAYIFDVFFEDSYPDTPPKVNLSTTGSGQVRFNPNLYSCGKVCLSLLGTWRGVASENWDAKISTLLQVLVSIQSIIMAEEVYFNEPGHEHEAGTVQGEKYNEAYSNIVRYANIKFAMLEQIKNPPKGFETIIKRHFYLKKDEILEECEKWLKYAKTREADYKSGLISSHNSKWCQEFQKSKDRYEKMLGEAIDELKIELNKLEPPSFKDLKLKKTTTKKKKSKEQKQINIEKDGVENLDEIDITYEKEDKVQPIRELDINDEKVKDRWSRYIGAMGIDAVAKQSKCSIFLSGINSLGLEIAKNIILGGVKRFTIHDQNKVTYNDLAGQFYVNEDDIGKNRAQASVSKLQQLNYYVKVDTCDTVSDLPKTEEEIEKQLKLQEYNIVILIEQDYDTIIAINNYCRKRGIKFMNADLNGPFAKLFNDFGDNFEVVDKNGEDPVECMISNITNEENGVVTLLPGLKHPYEDGDTVVFREVEGMELQNQENDEIKENKEKKSINGTIHKIVTINSNSFKIGDTRNYSKYVRNGLVKNIKVPVNVSFKSFQETHQQKEIPFDENMNVHDFMKFDHSLLLHICYNALNEFKKQIKNNNNKNNNNNLNYLPQVWNLHDQKKFEKIALEVAKKHFEEPEKEENLGKIIKLFAFSCGSQFAPLGAFMGGYISQEVIKAITGKYRPTTQYFYTDCIEVLPDLPEKEENYQEFIEKLQIQPQNNRLDGIRQCVGTELMEKIQYSRIFMIGCGAIGCELLKNFAMISLFTGQQTKDKKQGLLTITDPDHIETSNLNRQFLFREKHLRKPKSSTGAAVALGMNPLLKGHINARLDKVHEGTVNIYSDEFFGGLTLVANALDNVQARRYVDLRCVKNKIPLLDSGTLGPKGHVQVVIPHQTESYGSQQDPGNEDGEIPHCTLKMFPEETLHCVEWSKDKFGKLFTLRPKAILKIIEDDNYQPTGTQDLKTLREAVKLLKNKPKNFDDCIAHATKKFYKYFRNDIRQLLYTYPPDMKTKDGEPFWKLPKRPPQEVTKVDPKNPLHCSFIASVAVMRAKIFKIPLPENYRSDQVKQQMAIKASEIQVPDFKPSDEKAKEISSEVNKDDKNKEEKKENQEQDQEEEKENQEEEGKNIQNLEEEMTNLMKELTDIKKSLPKENLKPKNEEQNLLQPEDFEKDEDQNGHIDYIYSLANMRSSNYKLEPMDWLQVKLKAGRIVPALATTTAAIAGLQTIELVKILKKEKTENMKNAFLNLAVPILQLTEPGAAQKTKLHEELSVTLWDQWEIQNAVEKQITLKQMFKILKEKYKLQCHDVFLGNKCLYSSLVMNMKGKEKENETVLNTELVDLLDPEEDQKYSDLTITFSNLDSTEILSGTPSVRVFFN